MLIKSYYIRLLVIYCIYLIFACHAEETNEIKAEVYNAIPGENKWPVFFDNTHTSQCSQCFVVDTNVYKRFHALNYTECITEECKLLQSTIVSQRVSSSWRSYYGSVIDYIKKKFPQYKDAKNHPLRIVEIGTCWGGNALSLAMAFPCANVVAIDPFLGAYDIHDGQSRKFSRMQNQWRQDPEGFSKLYATAMFDDIAGKRGQACNYNLVRALSVEGSKIFAEKSVDLAFVDGLHTYEGVRDDIEAWLPKMKPGGVLMFNDYAYEGTPSAFEGVGRAVREYAKRASLEVQCCAGHGNAFIELP